MPLVSCPDCGRQVSTAAAACPQCASREGSGYLGAVLLGAMILLPFGVFAIVLRIIRRGAAETESRS